MVDRVPVVKAYLLVEESIHAAPPHRGVTVGTSAFDPAAGVGLPLWMGDLFPNQDSFWV